MEKADGDAVSGKCLADEPRLFTGHDFEQRALAGAVQSQHTDLRAGQKRQPDIVEDFGVGRIDLPETLHRVDKLGHSQSAVSSQQSRQSTQSTPSTLRKPE